jgi:hypothetical protein
MPAAVEPDQLRVFIELVDTAENVVLVINQRGMYYARAIHRISLNMSGHICHRGQG